MWDLPRPGLEPVSPALAGRFSTTAPPGKPDTVVLLGPCGTLWAAFKGSSGQCHGWGRRGFTSSMGSSRCLLFSVQHMWLQLQEEQSYQEHWPGARHLPGFVPIWLKPYNNTMSRALLARFYTCREFSSLLQITHLAELGFLPISKVKDEKCWLDLMGNGEMVCAVIGSCTFMMEAFNLSILGLFRGQVGGF